MKTTIRCAEDTIKENREDCVLLERGLQQGNRGIEEQETGKREGGWEKKIQRQGGKWREEEIDGMD
jgi:hypothetical protein